MYYALPARWFMCKGWRCLLAGGSAIWEWLYFDWGFWGWGFVKIIYWAVIIIYVKIIRTYIKLVQRQINLFVGGHLIFFNVFSVEINSTSSIYEYKLVL